MAASARSRVSSSSVARAQAPTLQTLAPADALADGRLTPMWMPGDDELAERLQVTVLWQPLVYINGELVHPFGLGPEPLPDASITARIFKKAVVADRGRFYDEEMAEVAEALEHQAPAWKELTRAYVAAVMRLCLARRGYPLP